MIFLIAPPHSSSFSPPNTVDQNPISFTSEDQDVNSSGLPLTPSRLFHPEIYGGKIMLSPDKIINCAGNENSTSIDNNPGATILSPILLSLTGITGQIIALVYLHRQTKPSYGRTVFYVMLATLIWTDLIGKVITTPPAILSYAYGEWVGGMKMCKLHGYTMITIGLVTHFLVSAMAIDRFLCVRHGYFYRTNVTKSKARIILMGIWIFTPIFCALPLMGMGELEAQYPGTWCFINIHVGPSTPWPARLYSNLYGVLNILNLITIVICNLIVIGTLIQARTSRSRLSAAITAANKSSYQRELEIQMVILLVVITVVFLSSWSPLDLRLFLNQIWPHTCLEEHVSDLVAIRLVSFNQILDPWIYIICRRIFASRAWKRCRSTILGGGFSSLKRDHLKKLNSLKFDRSKFAPEVGQIDCTIPARAFERRHSMPSTELCKITLLKETDKEPLKQIVAPLALNEQFDDVFRDSGTASGKDDASFSSDECQDCQVLQRCSGKGFFNEDIHLDHEATFLSIPIPVFIKEQYKVSLKNTNVIHSRRGNRLFSSHSAHSGSTRKKDSLSEFERKFPPRISGRSHSWSCSPSVYKQFRSQSTQTNKGAEEDTDSVILDDLSTFK